MPTYWWVLLCLPVFRGELDRAGEAQRELRRLGYDVRVLPRAMSDRGEPQEAGR